MKRISLLLLSLSAIFLFSACGRTQNPTDDITVRVAALRGPTAIGLLHMMETTEHEFELLGAPIEVAPLLALGQVDVAAVPSHLASVFYNQMEGSVQALAVVTLGVLHIVDMTGEVQTVSDLAGRTIYSIEGATPEFALNYVLRHNGLIPGEDVFVEFYSEPTMVAAALETGLAEIALLPEPFVSTVLARIDGLRLALDLTEEWNRVQPDYGLIMSVVIARRDFLEKNPAVVAAFMEEYARSIAYMTSGTAEAAQLAVDYGLVPNINVALQALPRTHMVFINGETMKRNLLGFYRVLYDENPASIGGRLPDEDFFFIP
ncbi:MAG: ABC transporter substrate-binding protein [Defluviitaleaceae bacterium]|nr:ABC transporter substrate-binding protein [Defluviitaleaceae bacterium]